ncbi:portal protein [Stenotrophomonas phage BUCT627]|uniref:Portal protein n=3 Tax=Bixiavirus TaxID=3044676 RepID=A0A7D2LFP2_9CAUD|nr:portal protein [Stenotrophomonas phage vB_SmaS_BUCT548]YP_010677314.1 portal protein [Stenotrophomonas phage BUCT626]YP_010677492.1 portal protein [Stenotrophomonas phage BUCT627]WFG37899.1 portal protein [Pseudomonas phage 20Sep420]QIQ60838.1 portal protein [Stenotrophomonas phage vB_SmaS_BUCT548]QYC96692.1 portal protein [Stenotrophomonas phage BUCT627]QYC96710.1 portal protein [Stenotrophomonas phage BUCT626]
MLTNKHPQYLKYQDVWQSLRDFNEGSDKVKDSGVRYLPPTEGMELDGMKKGERGYKAYQAYKLRARVPDYITEGVRSLVGLLHQKPATIRLPERMEYLRESASPQGESLQALYRRINTEQLITGRLGLLADIAPTGGDPYIALYRAESITNWNVREGKVVDSSLRMVVLDESAQRFNFDNFGWELYPQYRVCWLDDSGKYVQAVFENNQEFNASAGSAPVFMGQALDFVPFEFINGQDTLSDIDDPPLRSLLDICIGIYLGEADYRQNLYYQSQQTLVVKGGVRGKDDDDDAIRTGAGSRIDVDITGDAKYIGVTNAGLSEQRNALENDRRRAEVKSGELVQNSKSQAESGKAMATRYNAQTATLNQLATAAAEGLENILRRIATWMGLNPDEVSVLPNTEFIDFSLDGRNFADIMSAIQDGGLPLSLESVHEILQDRGLTSLSFEAEMKRLEEEDSKFGPLIEKMMARKAKAAQSAKPPEPANDGKAPTGNVA